MSTSMDVSSSWIYPEANPLLCRSCVISTISLRVPFTGIVSFPVTTFQPGEPKRRVNSSRVYLSAIHYLKRGGVCSDPHATEHIGISYISPFIFSSFEFFANWRYVGARA